MATTVTCCNPTCGKRLIVRGNPGRIRCPKCRESQFFRGGLDPPAGDGTNIAPNTARTSSGQQTHWNLLVSLLWSVVGLYVALSAPTFAFWPAVAEVVANFLPLLATIAIIIWNLAAAIRLVGKSGHALSALPLTLMQVILFTLLFYQIAAHQGAHHYAVFEAPRAWHWLGFSLAHAVRAADLIDGAEAYGVRFQLVQHRSQLAAICVILYHLVIDLFLLRLVMEWIGRLRRMIAERLGMAESRPLPYTWIVSAFFVLGIVWLISALFVRPWRAWDMVLWPIDNLVRVVDFFDAMEIYHIRIHNVPRGGWEGTLTFCLRLLFALTVGKAASSLLTRISLESFGGFGLSEGALREVVATSDNKRLKQAAARRLALLAANEASAMRTFRRIWRSPLYVTALLFALFFGFVLLLALPNRALTRDRLVETALGDDDARAIRALRALKNIGPNAESCVADVERAVPSMSAVRREAAIDAFGGMGRPGMEALERIARDTSDPETQRLILVALCDVGPRAVGTMLRMIRTSGHTSVRETGERGIAEMGDAAVQPLADAISPENAAICVGILERIDPYWDRHSSDNPHYDGAVRVSRLVRELRKVETQLLAAEQLPSTYDNRVYERGLNIQAREIVREILNLGPISALAEPDLAKWRKRYPNLFRPDRR